MEDFYPDMENELSQKFQRILRLTNNVDPRGENSKPTIYLKEFIFKSENGSVIDLLHVTTSYLKNHKVFISGILHAVGVDEAYEPNDCYLKNCPIEKWSILGIFFHPFMQKFIAQHSYPGLIPQILFYFFLISFDSVVTHVIVECRH